MAHSQQAWLCGNIQYRNFSDFINHYRILDAGRQLIGTDKLISNIGLEVGYISLSVSIFL
jgi:AraC-like DNA-binding protein